LIRIDVDPIKIGDKFEKIQDIKDLSTGEEKEIDSALSQILLVNFWATWNKPSLKFFEEINKID
jgi:hypothetical protein